MKKLLSLLVLSTALFFGYSLLSTDKASADTNIDAVINPGYTVKVAEEYITGDFKITGRQLSLYAGYTATAVYYSYDSDGKLLSQETKKGNISFSIEVDANIIFKKVRVVIRNIGSAAMRFIGKLDD